MDMDQLESREEAEGIKCKWWMVADKSRGVGMG